MRDLGLGGLAGDSGDALVGDAEQLADVAQGQAGFDSVFDCIVHRARGGQASLLGSVPSGDGTVDVLLQVLDADPDLDDVHLVEGHVVIEPDR